MINVESTTEIGNNTYINTKEKTTPIKKNIKNSKTFVCSLSKVISLSNFKTNSSSFFIVVYIIGNPAITTKKTISSPEISLNTT